MGDSTSNRSNLVDVTFQELHGYLSGSLEGSSPTQIAASLRHRSSLFRNISEPYGKPSATAKAKVESGAVALADGVTVKVEDEDKLFVLAISDRFALDEIQALVLFRSFLYNQGLPKPVASKKETVVVDELLDTITPFYYAERLSLLRTLIPLVQATDDTQNSIFDISEEFLADVVSDKPKFVAELLNLYAEKTKGLLPMKLAADARSTAQWLIQNMKEQLVILELLFWMMWSYANCDGPTVTKIVKTAYSTRMGLEQGNAALMLDDESQQLIRDGNALWNVFILEIFELERFASGEFDLSEGRDLAFFPASASALSQIHQLVTSHPDSDYVCIYLAWAFILSRVLAVQAVTGNASDDYQQFLASLAPTPERAFAGGMETIPLHMARMCLSPEAGLFAVVQNLLTSTSLFVTSIAWRTGSSITDPNAVGFRSIIKGLLNALLELVPVEMIPDFEGFADVWIALYGRSDSKSVHTICWQYWTKDWQAGTSRRAVFDVARSRFPVLMRPLICLLRAMTGFGYIETDPIATSAGMNTDPGLSLERDVCNGYVFHYFQRLSSYTLTIPSTNEGVLYEKVTERGKPIKAASLNYVALQDLRVPGGSTIKAGTIGRLLSNDSGDHVVIAWQHEHSGWKFLLEILTHYVYQRRSTSYHQVSFGDKAKHRASVTITLDDLRAGEDDADFEELVVDTLALVRCVVQDDVAHAEDILRMMSAGAPVIAHTSSDTAPPDLVQLITMILEDRLSRGRSRSEHGDVLITSTLSLLSALLAVPRYCDRVWLYLRSTSSLFGSERSVGSGSAILAADRAVGRYTMTLALLRLVEGLFREASASVLPVMADMPKLQEVKEEVLLRAARFVHSEIWVEYSNWKYAHISDRFEIGHRVAAFFADIYRFAPPVASVGHFTALTQAIADTFLFKAATTSIVPLVSAVASAGTTMATLSASRRFGDARRLTLLLESHLALIRSVLNHKQRAGIEGTSLLEETLFARGQNMAASTQVKIDVIDAITGYVRDRRVGVTVPVEAAWILNSLCAMFPHNSSIIAGRLEAPENAMAALVRIGQHPYDDPSLRQAAWAFMTLAIDKEPALATILVSGRVGIPDKFAPKALTSDVATDSAFDVACAVLTEWKELWELNPRLLSSVIGFLAAVWAHGYEHRTKLDTKRTKAEFWEMITGIVSEELGPAPDYRVEQTDQVDGVLHSDLHDAVATHAYRTRTKALALRIIDLDVEMHLQTTSESGPKPASYMAMEKTLKNEDNMTEQISEAGLNIFDPLLHDEFAAQATIDFPALALASLQAELPPAQWECGDTFAFNLSLLQRRMQTYLAVGGTEAAAAEQIVKRLMSINLNLSLAQSQTELTKAWTALIRRVCPYLRSDVIFRRIVLALCSTLSTELAAESRAGEMMAAIHGEKMALVLALLEVAWFSTNDKAEEAKSFMFLVKQLPAILFNPAQYPPSCLINRTSVPFHRTILQIIFFCVQQCRKSLLRPQAKPLVAEQRLAIAAMVDSALNFVIGGLRVVFEAGMQGLDLEIDRDMELLVSVFQQCTMRELTSSTTAWLGRCQEQDIIQASLRLFNQLDVANADPSTLAIIQSQGEPLYVPHILAFHMALAVVPLAAERLASEGVIPSYSNSGMVAAVRMGAVTTSIPELPSKRNPAHTAYCSIVATVAGVLSVVGRQHHYLDQDTIAFIQIYGDQMTRALSWTIGDPLTLPLLEEIEQTVHLFHAIVESLPFAASQALDQGSEAEPILRIFAGRALILVQQLNYALTHPNHLSTLVEPITLEERTLMEQDEAAGSDSDAVDPFKRPFLTRLVHRLFRLSTLVLVTLANIGGAETVLLGDREDWSSVKAAVVPHSKVVLSEPATTGTLLELCNCAFDILRKLSTTSVASQAVTAAGPRGEKALDAGESTRAVRNTLEAAALYAVTQLALWSVKPNNDENGASNIELDEPDMGRTITHRIASTAQRPGSDQPLTVSALRRSVPARASSPEARKVSVSSTTGERMRRGMNSDIAADIYAMLNKAQPVLQKLPKGDRDVDLLAMLAKFLRVYGLVE